LSGRMAVMNFRYERPAVFFDRDGVLNEDIPGRGILHVDELELLPGAAEAVRLVNDAGALAVLVTNQPQVAKGQLSFDELDRVMSKLETLLGAEGAKLDRSYICPHHPDAGFEGERAELKIPCVCRKPSPGLVIRATQELPIDLRRSCVIGDTLRDIGLARACGMPIYGVETGGGCQGGHPDRLFSTVLEAVVHALKVIEHRQPAKPMEGVLT